MLFSVGLWLLCYAYQPFYVYDLVFIWIYECIPSCRQTSQPKNLENPKTLFCFIEIFEIVLACSLVVWEQFLA